MILVNGHSIGIGLNTVHVCKTQIKCGPFYIFQSYFMK